MLKCEGQRKPILQKLWFVASCQCPLVRICMWCCKGCWVEGAAVHVGSGGFSVVFEAGAPCCWWRCSLCLCSPSNTASFWDGMCRILEQKVKQALAFPASCSWHINSPLQRPTKGFWIFLMLHAPEWRWLTSLNLTAFPTDLRRAGRGWVKHCRPYLCYFL